VIVDIEDNYLEYVDDERGYTWDAWDVLSADVIRRHDDVLRSSAEELAALDPAGLDDLDRLAYGRASRRHGDLDGFLDAGRLILASGRNHRGVDYRGVYAAVIETLARQTAFDEARLLHEEMGDRWPDDEEVDRLQVWIALHFDEASAAAAIEDVLSRRGRDPELIFELCEDALTAGRAELASQLLARTEAVAREENLSAILVDVELLREKLGASAATEE
jgi:hypothetical protein